MRSRKPWVRLRRRLLGPPQWEGGHGEHAFNRNPAIAAASQALVWTWKAGFTEIALPWGAQVRPAGGASMPVALPYSETRFSPCGPAIDAGSSVR